MKILHPNLISALSSEAQMLCLCWLITRQDEEQLGFTNFDKDVKIGQIIFKAALGFSPSNLQADRDFEANNIELSGVFSTNGMSERDLRSGRFDYARLEIFLLNPLDPPGSLTEDPPKFLSFPTGTLGKVSYSEHQFNVEALSLTEFLQGRTGWVISKDCRNRFGNTKCGINLEDWQTEASVQSATKNYKFTASQSWDDNYLTGGDIEFLDEPFEGIKMTISKQLGSTIYLSNALPSVPETGVNFKVTPNCGKLIEHCEDFENRNNFNGEPTLPGLDKYASNQE